jgi:hypothetical protein
LVLSIDDSTAEEDEEEAVIQRMIEAIRKFIREGEGEGEEGEGEGIPISSVTKRHFQLQIKTLQNAPRDAAKLEQIIKAKERENNDKAMHIDDTQRLVTEIEMLNVVLYLVMRKR